MTLIKVEILVGIIIITIVTVSLTWGKDFVVMKRNTSSIVQQLQADQRHINDKIRKIQ